MNGLAKRMIASVAIVVSLALSAPAVAFAGTTTTTTIATKSTVITTMKQWRAADRLYLAKLKVINVTFLAAVATAKADLVATLSTSHDSAARITARAAFRVAITEATIARSDALTLLGKPPVKPGHRSKVVATI